MRLRLSDFIKNKSVRGLIVLIVSLEISIFALLAGYLSYVSGLQTITKNAAQISLIVNDEITKMLGGYLEEPYQIEQIHRNVIINNQIDFSNQIQRDKHFAETLKTFSRVTNTYVGLANGQEFGARREDDGSIVVWNSNIERKTLDYYRYDSQSGRQGYIRSLTQYDTRQRPPYLRGSESKKPAWTDIYASATGRGLVITAVHPIITAENELIGVLGSSLLLEWVDKYLKALPVTPNSSIYIIGKNGKIIAASDDTVAKTKKSENTTSLVNAGESDNPLLSRCVKALKEKVQSLESINKDVDLHFAYNDEKYLLHAHAIDGKNKLEWISIVLIPEKDLTYHLEDLIKQLLLITVIACILGLITGILSARRIINPIIKVNQAAKKIADGDFSTKIEASRQDEIGELVQTVNEMSSKLDLYFKKLREDHLRIKLLTAGLETSSNLVVILEQNRSIWWVNTSFEVLSGYALDAIIGQNIKLVLSEQNNPEILRQIIGCMNDQREWRGEIIARCKDGRDYVDEVSVTPIRNDKGEISYFLVVGQDITEKVKAREAMQAAQEAKAKAEKLLSIGTMAAGISHEINQPLNSIKVISSGMVYLLGQGEKIEAEEFSESIKEISSQADRITKIIKHLRSFIHRKETQLVPCDVNTAVELALGIVGKQISAHAITVKKELQYNLPPVQATATGLEEIIMNLLVNAMQALDTTDKQGKEITIRTYFSTNVILEISDNGPGVNPALKKTLFETFTSTKLQGENLGLGLAIVKTIVASYSGTIEVVSNDKEGATFTVALPVFQNDNKEKAE